MSKDWDAFADECNWYVQGRDIVVGRSGAFDALPDEPAANFPKLAALLRLARATEVTIDGTPQVLLGWNASSGNPTGWLSPMSALAPPERLFRQHRLLLRSFGGILERWNEPESWLLNLNDALTEKWTESATFIEAYKDLFTVDGATIPIDLTAWYNIAREANGNATICNRQSGRVLLFATDHSFKHITPLEGCPEYTLYTIDAAPSFTEWVEVVAAQWLARVNAR